MATLQSDVLVIGGGLAGIVTALECLRGGRDVVLVDRDTPECFGGLALSAFGGMTLVGTPLQTRKGIVDSPQIALRDWLRFGELDPNDSLPIDWAKHYVEHSRTQVYDWLLQHGLRFMPSLQWVERGLQGEGNSVPRYHILWGGAQALVRRMIAALHEVDSSARLTLLHRHRVIGLDYGAGGVTGALVVDEESRRQFQIEADAVVLATGGINGSLEETRNHWPRDRPQPMQLLNGAHPNADGRLHHQAAGLGAQVTHAGEMWNYAAGVAHPKPHFEGHGLSLIPCKSALWLNHRGERIGPQPLVTGFDTHWLCEQVAKQERPWTWHLLNRRIALKELAISGAEHNPHIRDQKWWPLLTETLLGNRRLVQQMQAECPDFLTDASLSGLAAKMNALTGTDDVAAETLRATANAFDTNFSHGQAMHNDDQIRRILHTRQWRPDRLRTCKPAPLQKSGSGPFIAIRLRLITRKSLGGLRTNLQSRVLDANDQPIPGLYAVGEAAGFGGGGACGKRSLEGTFLPACILTARTAAHSIITGL